MHAREAPGFVIGNVATAGMARTLERQGYRALATTSAGAAETAGLADGELPLDQLLQNAELIAAAVDLPVSADLENGRGATEAEVAQVYRRVAQLGLAGASIEDSSSTDGPLMPIDGAAARVRAAIEAARVVDADFVLTARTETFLTPRPEPAEAITRLRAYVTAGADVVFAPGLPVDAIPTFITALDRPLNVLVEPGQRDLIQRLLELGVKRISLGAHLCRTGDAAVAAQAAGILERVSA